MINSGLNTVYETQVILLTKAETVVLQIEQSQVEMP